eukprot:3682080-Ditylum_brightwellii.AAC.1
MTGKGGDLKQLLQRDLHWYLGWRMTMLALEHWSCMWKGRWSWRQKERREKENVAPPELKIELNLMATYVNNGLWRQHDRGSSNGNYR